MVDYQSSGNVQIACAISDAKTLRAFSTCFASSFTVISVLIADSISQTGGAGLADHQYQTKNPASFEAGFLFGTSGRTRTGTLLRAGDFESPMSTNSITLAFKSVLLTSGVTCRLPALRTGPMVAPGRPVLHDTRASCSSSTNSITLAFNLSQLPFKAGGRRL